MTPEEFRQTIKGLGWTQARFCEKTGLHQNIVSRWMTGKTSRVPSWVSFTLSLATILKRNGDSVK